MKCIKSLIKIVLSLLVLMIFVKSNAQECTESLLIILKDSSFSSQEKDLKTNKWFENNLNNRSPDSVFHNAYEIIKVLYKQKDINEAIALNRINIKLMSSLKYPNNSFYRKNFYSLGYYLMKNNSNDEAIIYFSKVLELANDDRLAYNSSKFISRIYYDKLEFHAAAEHYENTIKIGKELKNVDYVTENSLYAGNCYKNIKTKKSLNQGIKIINEAISFEKENYTKDTVYEDYIAGLNSLHRNLGNLYLDRVDYNLSKAKENYELSLTYAQILNDSLRLGDINHDIGIYHLTKDHSPRALEYFNKALSYRPDNLLKTYIHKSKSRYYLGIKAYNKSKIEIQKAINTQISSTSNHHSSITPFSDFNKSQNKFELMDLLINKAVIFSSEAQHLNDKKLFNKALKILENADALLDDLRLNTFEYKDNIFWKSIFSELYANAVNVCYALNKNDKAFYFIEKNKAVLLKEDIEQRYRKNRTNIPKKILHLHDSLKHNIEKHQHKNSDNLKELELIAKQNYSYFIDTLDIKYKHLFKTIEPTKIIHLNTFKSAIHDNNQIFLNYIIQNDFLGFNDEKIGFCMLITNSETKLFKLENADSLKRYIERFRTLISKPINTFEEKENLNQLSFDLYNILIPEALRPRIKDKVITIVADNFLNNIPFEALNTSKKDNDFLILKNEINYAYSLSLLADKKELKKPKNKDIIAFAPINFNKGLPNLPYSESELNNLENHIDLRSDVYKYTEASKVNFKTKIEDYKLIHISTHASANKSGLPHLIFHDSILNINEIYKTNNNAELIVLNACETSLGELIKGEGVMSLARSFYNTGSKSVISNLWSVNDKSSAELMENFYENIEAGLSKSKALRNAKLNYLESHSLSETSPYYWASFILIGNTNPIEFNNNPSILYIIAGIVLFVILFFLYKKKKIK